MVSAVRQDVASGGRTLGWPSLFWRSAGGKRPLPGPRGSREGHLRSWGRSSWGGGQESPKRQEGELCFPPSDCTAPSPQLETDFSVTQLP